MPGLSLLPVTVIVDGGLSNVYYIYSDQLDTPRQITNTSGHGGVGLEHDDPVCFRPTIRPTKIRQDWGQFTFNKEVFTNQLLR